MKPRYSQSLNNERFIQFLTWFGHAITKFGQIIFDSKRSSLVRTDSFDDFDILICQNLSCSQPTETKDLKFFFFVPIFLPETKFRSSKKKLFLFFSFSRNWSTEIDRGWFFVDLCSDWEKKSLFCSTSLPLTSTRWFDQLLSFTLSTLSKQCPVNKSQREHRESNQGRLVGKRGWEPLCYAVPLKKIYGVSFWNS